MAVSLLIALGSGLLWQRQTTAGAEEKGPLPPSSLSGIPPQTAAATHAQTASGKQSSPPHSALSGGAGDATPPHPLLSSVRASSPLPASTIAAILSQNAVDTAVHGGRVSRVHSAFYNANPAIEDSFSLRWRLPASAGSGSLFGMFDGHSGSAASVWCRRWLLPYLQWYRQQGWTEQLLDRRVFVDADAHFLSQAWSEGRASDGLSGACVNVVHVDQSSVTSANAGDCRAVIGRRVAHSLPAAAAAPSSAVASSTSPAFPSAIRSGHQQHPTHVAVALSHDHQIDTNPAERERLLSQHAGEDDVIRRNRVKGRLQPTRGFGDGAYKLQHYYAERSRLTAGRADSAVYRPPYTTVEPDVWRHELTADDDFLVLSTDGLFEDLSSQQVVEYVSDWMMQQQQRQQSAAAKPDHATHEASRWWQSWLGSRSGSGSAAGNNGSSSSSSSSASSSSSVSPLLDNVSSFLISRALLHASEAQIGRRATEAENLSWILRLPVAQRRNVHDDVSIIVVFFDHSAATTGGQDGQPQDDATLSPPEPLARALREAQSMARPAQAAASQSDIRAKL